MTEWLDHLHEIRRREYDLVFGGCPPFLFRRGLELGSGDGYESGLLSRHVRTLVASDFGDPPPGFGPDPRVQYRKCDAEDVESSFGQGEFDLVFSSNLLEHLPDLPRALRGIHRVLADDGVAIHAVPNVFWKASHLAGYYPSLALATMRAVSRPGFVRRLVTRRILRRGKGGGTPVSDVARVSGNNPKMPPPAPRLLWPTPHGAYASNVQELQAFRKRRWLREFEAAGFAVVKTLRGPVASGYGFGLDRVRRALERAGFASEHVFITVKRGRVSPFLAYF